MKMKTLEEFFNALVEAKNKKDRLEILAVLGEKYSSEMTYSELRKRLGFNPNSLSYDLGALVKAKLVEPIERKQEETSFRITELGRSYLKENFKG
jgi:DNA-binding transcriptional ArsR family regulator